MEKSNNIYKIIVIFILVITISGCFEDRINKSNYYLNDILVGNNWVKEGNIYSLNDMSGGKYGLYFDEKDYKKNFFTYEYNNYSYAYYYVTNEVLSSNSEDIDLPFIFETIISSIKLTKEDLYITSADINTTVINIDNRL